MIKKVAFIGHPTKDLEGTRKFYQDVLGLKEVANFQNCWIEFTTPGGSTIALDTFSPKQNPAATVYMALETDDIAKEMERLKGAGVKTLHDVFENKDQEGNEVCKMAIIADPEGNTILLHEIAPHRAS